MIVGCYSLDLYCDNFDLMKDQVEDSYGHRYDEFPHQFTGYSRPECVRNARHRGWIVNIPANKAYCPGCVKKHRRIVQKSHSNKEE